MISKLRPFATPVLPFLAALLASLALSGGLAACVFDDGGTEIPNELTGTERYSDGGAVVKAQVKLYSVHHVPGDTDRSRAVYATETDEKGRFALQKVPEGTYNILVAKDSLKSFRDSVVVTGKAQQLGDDVLKKPGALAGRVKLQPDHDGRTAVVQVLGTHVYVNAARDGSFELIDLAPGAYKLRAISSLDGYTEAFRDILIRSDVADSLAEPIVPFYSGVPVVTGLKARPGPEGTVVVSWNKADYTKVDGYLIYRDSAGALLPSTAPIARVQDTVWIDTVYSRAPRAGQHDFADTLYHPYVYRVRILDKSGAPGPAFLSVEGKAVPPSFRFTSGLWKRALEKAPFGERWNHSLVVFKDRLWMLGRRGNLFDSPADIWSSADGVTWRLEADSPPFPSGAIKAVAFLGRLFVMVDHPFTAGDFGTGRRNEIWSSADGLAWTLVTAAPEFPARNEAEFLVHGDKLVVMAGTMNSGMGSPFSDVWMSGNGSLWVQVNTRPVEFHTGRALSFAGRLRVLGGGMAPYQPKVAKLLSSADGAAFDGPAAPAGLFPRGAHAAAVHAGKMWIVAGNDGATPVKKLDDVWCSADGETWTLIDSHAPFQPRDGAAAASFLGRLWVSGGGSGDSPSDLWYYEGD